VTHAVDPIEPGREELPAASEFLNSAFYDFMDELTARAKPRRE
jgi:hypothetical protein